MRPNDHEMELEPGPLNHEDACMVCDKLDCECPSESMTTTQAANLLAIGLEGENPYQWQTMSDQLYRVEVWHDGIEEPDVSYTYHPKLTPIGSTVIQVRATPVHIRGTHRGFWWRFWSWSTSGRKR